MSKNFWASEENVEQLKEYWSAGLSCSQISRAFGREVSRNAIIGKAHRLGLAGRSTDSSARKPYNRPAPQRPRPVIVAAPAPEPVTFLCPPETHADGSTCRYISGHPNEPGWVMCGNPVAKIGESWCAFHRTVCFDQVRTQVSHKKAEAAEIATAKQDAQMRRVGG